MTGVEHVSDDALSYEAGNEYPLVDQVAELLGLSDWYEWRFQGEGADEPPLSTPALAQPQVEETPEGTTNPELLRSKDIATVMHMLGALQRFENMSEREVQQVTFEIGMVGQGGIDYTDPDRKYHLRTLPDEEFTGLQLLSMMFVGFKRIAPQQNTGLDFDEPYALALQMYEDGRRPNG